MTKDDIMKLALESGFAKILDEHASEYRDFTFELSQDHYPELERFVNLIAAVEREACEMAVEDIARKYQKLHHASLENIADECAAAIRARIDK